ncbi:MAG: caspase family protein [Rubrivivax sp.]|nr:caspase family protein [Rubrivivax sp.]
MVDHKAYSSFIRLETGTHTAAITQIAVTADGKCLVTAGETTLRVWDIETRKPLRTLLGEVSDPAALWDGKVLRFALSHDGRWVVALRSRVEVGVNRQWAQPFTQVQIFELATGDLRGAFDFPGLVFDLDLSHDDRYLALAVQPRAEGPARGVIEVRSWRGVLRARFKGAPEPLAAIDVTSADCETLPACALRFLPPEGLASNDYRLLWAGREPHEASRSLLAWYAFTAAAGLRAAARIDTDFIINPATLVIGPAFSAIAAYIHGADRSLDRTVFCQDHRGRPVVRLATEARPAGLAFSPTGHQLLVGMAAEHEPGVAMVRVSVFDNALGRFTLRSTYYGHDDSVAAAAFLKDGRVATAGGDNHSLHVWSPAFTEGEPLGVARGVGREVHRVGINGVGQIAFDTLPSRLLAKTDTGAQRIFDLRTLTLRPRSPEDPPDFGLFSEAWQVIVFPGSQTIGLKSMRGGADGARGFTFSSGYQETVEVLTPDLTLFVGADDEWVIWSTSGYYDASARGARHVGFQINRGAHREALYVPSDRFKGFYRPDIIQAVIAHGSEAMAQTSGVTMAAVDVADMLPPVIEMDKGGAEQQGEQITFAFTVKSHRKGHPVTRVWILHNGQFAWTAPSVKARYTVTLPLRRGPNQFAIHAETADAKAIPLVQVATGSAHAQRSTDADAVKKPAQPGKLFLLCVGVADFEARGPDAAGTFKPLKFARQDAIAIHNALAKGRFSAGLNTRSTSLNRAFESVEASVLLDRDATRAGIITEVQRLCAQISLRSRAAVPPRDVLFVYLSGHGVRFQGEPELYFWNHDLRLDQLSATGLSLIELGRIITSVPAEVVLAIDACHSGMAGSNVLRGLDPEELAQRIQQVNERGMYILNAARSEQLAFEHADIGHGFFTKAIVDTLRLDRSLLVEQLKRKERTVSMVGLASAVQELVPYYTGHRQSPVCRMVGDLLPLVIFKR